MVKALYIHIPFCHHKCPYCDFVSFTSYSQPETYLDLLLKEFSLYADLEYHLKTLYLGGGTPSIIKPKTYTRFLENLSRLCDLTGIEELTIECNPEDYTKEDFKVLRDIGFNRVSVGAQSFTKKGLETLGRLHTPERALKCVEDAYSAGFENINVDIIYGYHGQSLEDLEEDLKVIEGLPIKHASFYLLTPYEDTLVGHMYRKGLITLPNEELVEKMFFLIHHTMKALGFEHYEISNYSKEGYECKHNLTYWNHEEFLGIGVSAWSFIGGERWGNARNLELYTRMIQRGQKAIVERERLRGVDLFKDYLFVKLRTSEGVPKSAFPRWREMLERMGEFFEEQGDRIRLNLKGMLLLNEILLRVFKLVEHPHVV